MNNEPTINICPKTKRNRLFLLCIALLLLTVSSLLNYYFWAIFKIQLTLFFFSGFIVLLIAILKYVEPNVSYALTPKNLQYKHRSGGLTISWDNIVRIDKVYAHVDSQPRYLPYIGLKLSNIEVIGHSISPRLANKLLHEQQELIHLAIRNGDLTKANGIINFDEYSVGNSTFKGPIAAWLHRCEQLLEAYGFQVFLPEDSFDRSLDESLLLLKQCLQSSKNYQQVTKSQGD